MIWLNLFGWLRGDVGQGSGDRLWNWWGGRDVGALRLESVDIVSTICEGDELSIRSGVRIGSLSDNHVVYVRTGCFLQSPDLLSLDSVSGLKTGVNWRKLKKWIDFQTLFFYLHLYDPSGWRSVFWLMIGISWGFPWGAAWTRAAQRATNTINWKNQFRFSTNVHRKLHKFQSSRRIIPEKGKVIQIDCN